MEESMKNYNYRYDVIGAYFDGVKEHPQTQMKKLGYEIIKSEPVLIADCWWFRVSNKIKNTPIYLSKMGNDFKFSDER
jgi:hypothetical protein